MLESTMDPKNPTTTPSHNRTVLTLIDELTRELQRLRASVATGEPSMAARINEDLRNHPGSTRADIAARTRIAPQGTEQGIDARR